MVDRLDTDVLKGPRDVKRASLGFWQGNRLEDILEVARGCSFAPEERLTVSDVSRDARQSAACGHHLVLHSQGVTGDGEAVAPYVHKGYYCQMPAVCQICSRRVGDVRQARYSPLIETCLAQGLEPYLVTFTIDAGSDLRVQTARLRRAIRRFQVNGRLPSDPVKKARALARGRKGGEWQKVVAAGLKIEVKRGEISREWHVHAHALVFCSAPLDYRIYANRDDRAAGRPMRTVTFRDREVAASKISAEWLVATEGAAMGVDVHPLFIDRKTGRRMEPKGVVLAAREIMKYTAMLDEVSKSSDWVDVRRGVWGRRLWSVYGGFRGVPDDDYTMEDDAAHYVQEVRVAWRGNRSGDYEGLGEPKWVNLRERENVGIKSLALRARVNGMTRRMRSAIYHARQAFEACGELPEVFDISFLSPINGDRVSQQWPRPSYMTREAAASGEGWQRWVDEVTVAGRSMVATVEKDINDYDGDDILGYRHGRDTMISGETWQAWQLMLDVKRERGDRRRAFGQLANGGIQQDILEPDFFSEERISAHLDKHGYDSSWVSPEFYTPARIDPYRFSQ